MMVPPLLTRSSQELTLWPKEAGLLLTTVTNQLMLCLWGLMLGDPTLRKEVSMFNHLLQVIVRSILTCAFWAHDFVIIYNIIEWYVYREIMYAWINEWINPIYFMTKSYHKAKKIRTIKDKRLCRECEGFDLSILFLVYLDRQEI